MGCEPVTKFWLKLKHNLTHPREWLTRDNMMKVAYWSVVRIYGLMLIFFMLAIWKLVADPTQTSGWSWWLAWLDGPAALITTGVIIGVVQVAAVVLFTVRHIQHHGKCCIKKELLHSFIGFAKMLLFQWTVLNVTALLVALSTIGIQLPYSTDWAFILTVLSGLVQYTLFVRYYVKKRRAFVYWRFRDCFFVVLPLAAFLMGAFIIVLVNYVSFPLIDLIRSYLIAALLLFFFCIIGVPFVLYTCVLIPYQRHMKRKQYLPGKPPSVMEEAIRKELTKMNVHREDAESLLLVGLEIEKIEGLERAKALKRLYLTRNKLTSMRGLQGLMSLDTLHVEDNRIATFLDLLPLRGLPSLRKLSLERNPIALEEGFELEKVSCLLPQLTQVNGINITAAVKERAQTQYKEWLHSLLCEHHASVFQQSMPLLGSFYHAYMMRRSAAISLSPLEAFSATTTRHEKPHLSFYNTLLELKRHFRLVEAHSPDVLSDAHASVGSVEKSKHGKHHAKSNSNAIVWGNDEFV